MKKLTALLLTTVALFAASPAPAVDVDPQAFAFMQGFLYHQGCAKLPDLLIYGIVLQMKDIPDAVMMPAEQKVHDALVSEGVPAWCARIKPQIDKFIAAQPELK